MLREYKYHYKSECSTSEKYQGNECQNERMEEVKSVIWNVSESYLNLRKYNEL